MEDLVEPLDKNILQQMSEDRKNGQKIGDIPMWMTTGGYQMFMNKYSYEGQTIKETYKRIAACAAAHTPKPKMWNERFFQLMWDGWLACSSPVLSNMGTERGCPVSCSGGYVGDSIYNFYDTQLETAMLTKNGFGTSDYLGDIRPRGTEISSGGHSSGVVPVFNDYVQLSRDVSQGNTRRGAWAGYVEIDHADFYELIDDLVASPDDKNIGWLVTDNFIEKLDAGDEDSVSRYQRAMKAKCVTGKGYFVFIDRINRASPEMYKQNDLTVKASNLCVTGDTVIETNQGKMCISQLEESNHYKVKSKNLETGDIEFKDITHGGITGYADELILIEDDNISLSVTPDHKIYTKNRGYVMAKDLSETDTLCNIKYRNI